MKIRLTVDGQVATATLYDNATARDFAALLPLSLTLTDYARIERIAGLPQRLTRGSAETTVPVALPADVAALIEQPTGTKFIGGFN